MGALMSKTKAPPKEGGEFSMFFESSGEEYHWVFKNLGEEECKDIEKQDKEAQSRDMEETDTEEQSRDMEETDKEEQSRDMEETDKEEQSRDMEETDKKAQCIDMKKTDKHRKSKYQLFKCIEHIVLALKVVGTDNSPFNVFKTAILEISYRPTSLPELEVLMVISLESPSCQEEMKICKEHWEGFLVCRLVYKDHALKDHEIKMENPIRDDIIYLKVDMPPGNKPQYKARVVIEMNLTKDTTDIEYQTEPLLSVKEKCYVIERTEYVLKHMKQHESDAKENEVPTIAIIGSGGGIRATIGMNGAMTELEDNGILDLAMYTAGVSGSAWYLLTLYAENEKKLHPMKVSARIRENLNSFGKIKMAWNIFKYYKEQIPYKPGKYFTATNVFGKMIGRLLLGTKGTPKWSALRDMCSKPLPLVAALHVRDETKIKHYHEWIELSPYRVYIPKYGTAIDMEDFGSEFYNGILTYKYEEPPIHYLQGVCGSAYGIKREYRPEDHRNQEDRVQISEQGYAWFNPLRYGRYIVGQLFNIFDAFFLAAVPNFLKGTHLRRIADENDIIDFTKDYMMLLDAGLSFNSPYPLVLHPCRQVDLIISFDWSDRGEDKDWPFEELEKAALWASSRKVPFPKLKPELDRIRIQWFDEKKYKEVYVFPGYDTAPTIVHFVMINESFRALNDFNILPAYKTLRFSYSKQDFDKLTELVRHNVRQNRHVITECICTQVARIRRRNRTAEAV